MSWLSLIAATAPFLLLIWFISWFSLPDDVQRSLERDRSRRAGFCPTCDYVPPYPGMTITGCPEHRPVDGS